MKKKIFLPAGIAACLAVGIISSVSAADNTVNSASLKDVIEFDNIFFDSLTGNFGKSEEVLPVAEPETGSVATESAELPAVVAVSFDGEDDSYVESAPEVETAGVRDEAKETASLPVSDTSDPMQDSEAVNAEYQAYTGVSEEQSDVTEKAAVTEDDIVELINDTVQTTAVTPDHSFDAKEISDLENEVKPVTGQSPDDLDEESTSEVAVDEQEKEIETEHEHVWKPVTETVHHDAETHTEEVLISCYDNNKTFRFLNLNGDVVCNVHIHGTIEEYEGDELISAEGVETEGVVDIYNVVTGERFSFAPGELESVNEFVYGMFDDELIIEGLLGPAWCRVEEKEMIDKEAYDEEVITGYVCDCGEHKDL